MATDMRRAVTVADMASGGLAEAGMAAAAIMVALPMAAAGAMAVGTPIIQVAAIIRSKPSAGEGMAEAIGMAITVIEPGIWAARRRCFSSKYEG